MPIHFFLSRAHRPRIMAFTPPVWRNGRRDRLKIYYTQVCGGSSPSTGIPYFKRRRFTSNRKNQAFVTKTLHFPKNVPALLSMMAQERRFHPGDDEPQGGEAPAMLLWTRP